MASVKPASKSTNTVLRKYNPGINQSDDELIRQFVVRNEQLDWVLEVLSENIDSYSNQHLLIVAPRGRGKTMLLARVAAEIRSTKRLQKKLLPVRFMEESHEVQNIADFWLECILHLSNALHSMDLDQSKSLRQSHIEFSRITDDKTLEEKARATVLDCADRLKRKLVLMVENLQDLCREAGDDFGWQLRKILQNEPRIMLLASATSHFAALDDVKQPYYETFREIVLPPLSVEQCTTLWQTISGNQVSQREITPLKILTGGSPRLLIIVAGFARHRSMRQLMEELITLVDENTEYFKSHLDSLSPKERRVYLALVDLWQESTAREVAERARMDIRPTSALLGRLVNRGAVLANHANNKKYYVVTERLYSIYYKLRRERDNAAIVKGLIRFMSAFYMGPDLQDLMKSLINEAKQHSDIQYGLQLALQDDEDTSQRLLGCISYDDYYSVVGNEIADDKWVDAQNNRITEEYDQQDFASSLIRLNEIIQKFWETDNLELQAQVAKALFNRSVLMSEQSQTEDALDSLQCIIDRFSNSEHLELQIAVAKALFNRGALMETLDQIEMAQESYQRIIKLFSKTKHPELQIEVAKALFNHGGLMNKKNLTVESLENYQSLINCFSNTKLSEMQFIVANAQFNCGYLLSELNQTEKAFDSYQRIIDRYCNAENPEMQIVVAKALSNRGLLMETQGREKEAIDSYQYIITHFSNAEHTDLEVIVATALYWQGRVLIQKPDKEDEALASYQKNIDRYSDNDNLEIKHVLEHTAAGITAIKIDSKTTNIEEALTAYAVWYHHITFRDENFLKLFQTATATLLAKSVNPVSILKIINQDSERAEQLLPIVVTLRQEAGEKVRAPNEILETAADFRKEIEKIREQLKT